MRDEKRKHLIRGLGKVTEIYSKMPERNLIGRG